MILALKTFEFLVLDEYYHYKKKENPPVKNQTHNASESQICEKNKVKKKKAFVLKERKCVPLCAIISQQLPEQNRQVR